MISLYRSEFDTFVERQLELSNLVDTLPRIELDDDLIERAFIDLTRAAFRRSRIDEESGLNLKEKLYRAIQSEKPIAFAVPFGGYKNWKASSFPDPDWAEVFSINYLIRYVMPVAAYYPPGVVIQFTYCTGVMDLVSNLPKNAPIRYMEKFQILLELFNSRLSNIQLEAVDITSLYRNRDLTKELQKNYADNLIHWENKFPADEREKRLNSARRNLMKIGEVDLSNLSNREWDARCLDAAMWCEALDGLTHRRRFNKHSDNIQLVFVRGPGKSIHIGSCETSAHHFWSGSGIIEKKRGKLMQRILSEEKLAAYVNDGFVLKVPLSRDSILKSVSRGFDVIRVLQFD